MWEIHICMYMYVRKNYQSIAMQVNSNATASSALIFDYRVTCRSTAAAWNETGANPTTLSYNAGAINLQLQEVW
jgi:hypothetical protein